MRGITPQGVIIELTPLQEHIVKAVRQWSRGEGMIALPHIGRQGGKSVIMATVAEYDKLGWPDNLPALSAADIREAVAKIERDGRNPDIGERK